jgi:cell division protein FtsB
MERHGILRFLVFVIFFSSGAAALGGAVLCDDFIQYCRNKHLVKQAEQSIHKLEALNAEYDALLEQLENNPDLIKQIAPATLGTRIEDPNTVYPKARAQELAIARKTLTSTDKEPAEAEIPKWLQRCSDPAKRIVLFISGASLVLISMVCFTSGPDEDDETVDAASTNPSSRS